LVIITASLLHITEPTLCAAVVRNFRAELGCAVTRNLAPPGEFA
jgi:hypothetical protein